MVRLRNAQGGCLIRNSEKFSQVSAIVILHSKFIYTPNLFYTAILFSSEILAIQCYGHFTQQISQWSEFWDLLPVSWLLRIDTSPIKMVRVRNAWGGCPTWSGPFCAGSDDWKYVFVWVNIGLFWMSAGLFWANAGRLPNMVRAFLRRVWRLAVRICLGEYRALLNGCRALLGIYKVVHNIVKAVLRRV